MLVGWLLAALLLWRAKKTDRESNASVDLADTTVLAAVVGKGKPMNSLLNLFENYNLTVYFASYARFPAKRHEEVLAGAPMR
jgi:hypothetical protein